MSEPKCDGCGGLFDEPNNRYLWAATRWHLCRCRGVAQVVEKLERIDPLWRERSNDGVVRLTLRAAPPAPLLRQAKEALRDLLNDTQHKDHDCGDEKYCPVLYARKTLAALSAALGEPRG